MKVLLLTKYGPLAASTRHRYLQFLPHLEREGITCDVSPLLDDDYMRGMFAGKRSGGAYLKALIKRIETIFGAGRYDRAVVHCEAYPYSPPVLEWCLRKVGVDYIYDFDDAIFHQYDAHRSPLVRFLLGNKIRRVIRGASAVIAGNEYLASYARQVNDRVTIIPTVVDTSAYVPRTVTGASVASRTGASAALEPSSASAVPASPSVSVSASPAARPLTVGWIGSPSTAPFVKEEAAALAAFCARHPARVVLVGSGPIEIPGVPLELRAWSEANEVADIQSFDIGIMPLPDTSWARGKCGFKLIQYMACGIPVVASPVGVNADIVDDGRNGFLARTTDEWVKALGALAEDPGLRARFGVEGRAKAVARYSLEYAAPRFAAVIKGDAQVFATADARQPVQVSATSG